MRFYIFRGPDHLWRWRLCSDKGEILANCPKSFKRKSQATELIAKIIMGPHKIVE
jgi:uncharacterized protein YegP (UPF0339 family)